MPRGAGAGTLLALLLGSSWSSSLVGAIQAADASAHLHSSRNLRHVESRALQASAATDGAFFGKETCRKVGKDIADPTYDDCVKCVDPNSAARATAGIATTRACVFTPDGNCRYKHHFWGKARTRESHGTAETPAECRVDYYAGAVADSTKPALGIEMEFGRLQFYWGRSFDTLTPPGGGDDQIIAVSNAKLGPNNDLDALAVTVDLGATTELISGPIPIDGNTLDEFYQAMHAWAEVAYDKTKYSNCRRDQDGSRAVKTTYKDRTSRGRGRPLSDVLTAYNAKIHGTPAARFKVEMADDGNGGGGLFAQLRAAATQVRILKCLPSGTSKKTVVRPGTQVNYGMKIRALGKTGSEFVGTMGGGAASIGGALYTKIQQRLDHFLNAQATLRALKADPYMRAVFQAWFFTAATDAYWNAFSHGVDSRGFASKNVANSMLKGSVQDMIRACPDNVRAALLAFARTNPTALALANYWCENAKCSTANSMLNGLPRDNWVVRKGTQPFAAGEDLYKSKLQEQLHTHLTTQELFGFDTGRYGATEGGHAPEFASIATPATWQGIKAKPPGTHVAVKADACYGLFKIDNEPAIVVEARLGTRNPLIQGLIPDLSASYNAAKYRKSSRKGIKVIETLNA